MKNVIFVLGQIIIMKKTLKISIFYLLEHLKRFSHLTNNCVAKFFEKFDTSEIEGNMWS